MNVLWQDNLPSFLDSSSLAGAGDFAASLGDGGAPWFALADGGLFSGQPVLWWDNGADSATADSGLTGVAGFDPGGAAGGWLPRGAEAFTGANPALDGGLLWADPSGSTSSFALSGAGAGHLDLSAGNDASFQWQQLIGNSSTTWLTEASHLLWTGGQPPLTPPIVGTSPLTGILPEPTFPMLAPQQLVWTDPTQGLPAIISDPAAVGAAPVTLAGVGLLSQETGILPPISGAGSR
jgi:hypothetical protein